MLTDTEKQKYKEKLVIVHIKKNNRQIKNATEKETKEKSQETKKKIYI